MNRAVSNRSASGAPEFFSPQVATARRFYLHLNPSTQQKLVVVCGGLEQCRADYVINRPSFPFYSIEYVARGHGHLKLNGRTHELRPGRVFSYGPGIRHHFSSDARDPLVKYFVNFTGRGADSLLRECEMTLGNVAQIFPPDSLSNLFDELVQSGQRAGRRDAALCLEVLKCLALKMNIARAPLAGTETLAFTTYQDCRRHIDEHFHRLRTLEQISAECHADPAYLCRLFRRYDHQSPYQYLLRVKMRSAAERLQQPGALVKQIAEEAGFADPFHFSRVFKNVLGLSPAAFKRRMSSH